MNGWNRIAPIKTPRPAVGSVEATVIRIKPHQLDELHQAAGRILLANTPQARARFIEVKFRQKAMEAGFTKVEHSTDPATGDRIIRLW